MKRLLGSLVSLFCLGFVAPLSALTPVGGLVLYSTSAYVGQISSGQYLSFDIPTIYVADIELRVVDVNTNQVVHSIAYYWDYGQQGEPGPQIDFGYNDVYGLDGEYRVELDLLCPDFATSTYQPQVMYTGYYDAAAGHGSLYIDVGADQSDVWSWGGAAIMVNQ